MCRLIPDLLITWSKDGQLTLHDPEKPTVFARLNAHDPYSGGITDVAIGRDMSLYSVGADGAIRSWTWSLSDAGKIAYIQWSELLQRQSCMPTRIRLREYIQQMPVRVRHILIVR